MLAQLAQPLGEKLQQTVAGRVAPFLIGRAEIIDLEPEHGHRAAMVHRHGQRAGQGFLEQSRIGQIRQRIMGGQMLGPNLRLADIRHVPQGNGAGRPAPVRQGPDGRRHRKLPPIRRDHPDRQRARLPGGSHDVPQSRDGGARLHELQDAAPNHLVPLQSDELAERPIRFDDLPLFVHQHAFRGDLQQILQLPRAAGLEAGASNEQDHADSGEQHRRGRKRQNQTRRAGGCKKWRQHCGLPGR
jgi:hypothetical protein